MAWNFGDILDAVASVVPGDAPALIHGERVISWAETTARSNNLARGLIARGAKPKEQVFWLVATMVLGAAFLGIKVVEYSDKFEHHLIPGAGFVFDKPEFQQTAQIYFSLYFALTGLHATHMIVGIVIMAVICLLYTSPSPRDRTRSRMPSSA